jgi:hypothetical protein
LRVECDQKPKGDRRKERNRDGHPFLS